MSFRNTIDPTVGKLRKNAGKSYQGSVPITNTDNSTSPVRMFRKNAGKIYTPEPSQQIIEVVKPQLMRVAGKQRSSGSGGAIADTKTTLQSRIFLGYSGDSLNSDMGILRNISATGTVSNAQVKLGTNSLSLNNQNSGLGTRINEVLTKIKQFSICHWVYFHASFNYGGPWGSWDSVSIASGQLLLFNATGGMPALPQFIAAYNGANYQVVTASSGAWQLNIWYYMICEWDGINNKIRMFLDNILIGESTIPANAALNTGAETFGLGGYNNANNTITNMKGYLDEFVILTGNTTQSERDWLYNSGNGNSLV